MSLAQHNVLLRDIVRILLDHHASTQQLFLFAANAGVKDAYQGAVRAYVPLSEDVMNQVENLMEEIASLTEGGSYDQNNPEREIRPG